VAQKIAGELGEAAKAFRESRVGISVDPVVEVPIRMRKQVKRAKVTYASGLDHLSYRDPEPRKQRIRGEVAKRRNEHERTKPIKRVGKPFNAKHPGRCTLCHKRFGQNIVICKASTGYAHEDCSNPTAPSKDMTPARQAIRDTIAASRYSAV
jgi:hypothetical protein